MIYWNDTGTVAGIRLFLVVVSMIFGGLAALASIASLFGSTWWLFDYFANLRWYFLWILVAAAVIYSLTAGGWMLLVFIATAALNAYFIVPLWLGSQPESTGEAGFTVVSVDVDGGFSDRDEAFDWFTTVDADLLILANASSVVSTAVVGDEESDWIVLREPEIENTTGFVILAKQEWDIAEMPTGNGSDSVLRITVGTDETYQIVTAAGTTATSASGAKRLEDRIDTIRSITDQSSDPVTVIGNLGATMWAHPLVGLVADTDLRDATKGSGYHATSIAWNLPLVGGWIGLPLDVVMMTSDITPIDFGTGPDIGTSHLPVTVTIGPTV
ncbi:MAG: hypothetical protein KDB69_07705 [Acidimicrobiia bacterium]|nr:hypothetical protein [Acidimicrobiia bacterium]